MCERMTLQLRREPLAGTGIVYEAARQQDRFALVEGSLIPMPESMAERVAVACLA